MPATLADRVKHAEIAKLQAETRVLDADLEEKNWDKKGRESRSAARRVYDFVAEVDTAEVADAVDTIADWATESKDPITVRLDSPGGSVFDGFLLFDFLQDVRRSGIHVVTYAIGYAASMGAILSQAGDVRRISKNTWFMVHEPASLALGKASSIKDEAKLMERLHEQLCGILAARSKLNTRQVKARCDRRDWWMDAEEAYNHGFFDELV